MLIWKLWPAWLLDINYLLLFYYFCSDSILRGESTDFKKLGKRIFVFMIGGATRSEVGFVKNFSAWFMYLHSGFTDLPSCIILLRSSATSLLQDDNKIEKGSNPWNYQYPRTTTVYYGMYAHTNLIIFFLELHQILHAVWLGIVFLVFNHIIIRYVCPYYSHHFLFGIT